MRFLRLPVVLYMHRMLPSGSLFYLISHTAHAVLTFLTVVLFIGAAANAAPPPEQFAITIGQIVTNGVPGTGAGNIEVAEAQDIYTFNASAGQMVYFDALTGNPCGTPLRWKCTGPANELLFDQFFASSPACGNGDPGIKTLASTGIYMITVYGNGNGTGTYSFNVVPILAQNFVISAGQIVTNNVPGPGAGIIETPGATDTYTFNATARQMVYFDALTGNPCGTPLRWKCTGPANELLFDQWFAASPACGNGDPGTMTLTNAGTYTITVYGNADGTDRYSFNVVPILNQNFAITPGQIVTNNVPGPGAGVIEMPGATDTYTFNATARQMVYFDALTGNPCGTPLRWKCTGPANELLFDQWFAATPACGNGDPGTMTLTNAGTYTITVYGNVDGTDRYSFNVVPILNQNFAIAPGQIVTNNVPGPGAGVIETPGATDTYTFNATARQMVYFDALTGNPCGTPLRWKCTGPANELLFDQWFAATPACGNGDPGTMTLTNAGTYTITVYGNVDGTDRYSFNVVPILNQNFAITPGQIVTNNVPGPGAGVIETPGATDSYTFNAAARQMVYFDALTGNPCGTPLRWKCTGPANELLFDQWFAASPACGNGDPGTMTLTNAGTYTITVYGNVDGTGPYSFNVVPILAQTFAIVRDQIVTNNVPGPGAGVIEAPGATDAYTFNASAGQTVYFDALTGNPCGTPLRWKCLGPANELLFDQWFASVPACGNGDPGNQTFPTSGRYTIVVYGYTDGTGSYSFRLLAPVPVITLQPADQISPANRTVTFTVAAQSEIPLRYQWLFNGVTLPGQTQPSLTLANAQPSQSGTYSVLVENDSGPTLSRGAQLIVASFITTSEAARTALPPVGGNGVAIELFNGIGGGSAPTPDVLAGRPADGSTLSPLIDFPSPGPVINVGNSFNTFFASTATPPDQVSGLAAQNFILRHKFFLRVSKDLDTNPATPEIEFQLGVGSDDGFHLTVGTNFLGSAGDRGFTYTWMPVAFESEGLYPVTLLFAANAVGQSGLEFSWNTATSQGNQIVPQQALYLSPNVGDRLITFEEVPVGTVLTDQFIGQGIRFNTLAGGLQVTSAFPGRFIPVSPTRVFGDPQANPATTGEVELQFVLPGTTTPAVTDFVSFFILDAEATGATVTAFDSTGAVLFANTYHGGGASQELVSIARPRIARVRITLGQGADASAIDDISFTSPASGADLIAGLLQVPVLLTPGNSATIVWGVTNAGITTAAGPWTEQIVLSPENEIGRDVVLAAFSQTDSLAPGAFLVRTQAVTVPITGPAGTLRFGVRVDAFGEVSELNKLNNTALATETTDIPFLLTLQLSAHETVEGAEPILATVFRNGDLSQPLTIGVTNSNPSALTASASVTIPASQSAVDFLLRAPTDGIVDGPQFAQLSLGAASFLAAIAAVTVDDADIPQLGFDLLSGGVSEGAAAKGVVRRPIASADPLTVFFSTSNPQRLQTPISVTIPANESSASVDLIASDDSEIGPPRRVSVTAYAPGYTDSPPVTLTILDNDLPALDLTLSKNVVGEGDGPQATVATLSRFPVGNSDLLLELTSSKADTLQVPTRLMLPAGQETVSFPVGAVDNKTVDAPRQVMLTAFVLDAATGKRLSTGTSATLTVTDDDGPSLRLVIARKLVSEGLSPATTATLTRTGNLNQLLTVNLTSSDPGEATVPGSVVLLAGQASTVFNITSVNDGLPDGSQIVNITANAPGFGSASDTLVVSDLGRPDLIVSNVAGPGTADTEASVNVSYRIVNQGLTPASTNVLTRVFLSKDAVVGDDTLLGQFNFTGTLPPEQFFEQTLQVRMPTAAGDYWLVVTTDIENNVLETLEDNNTTISAVPIHVREAYTATVAADLATSVVGTPVVLRGRALKADSTVPAPQVSVHVHLVVRETRRVLLAVTDDEGNFTITFQPLPNEAGNYDVAAAHPGAVNPPAQDHFTILGLRARTPEAAIKLIEQTSTNVEIPLENLSEVPLTGLQATIIGQPGNITATAAISGDGKLLGFATNKLQVVLAAKGSSVSEGDVQIRVTTAEGVKTDISLPVTVESLQPRLTVTPADELVAGMKRGAQAIVEFDLINSGGAASGPVSVLVPDLPWLHVASANPLASLDPNQTNRVTLQLTPAADLPLGEYTGTLVLRAGDLSLSVPFRFRALAEAKGDLRVTAVDEYTYYAEGSPRVTNAVVTVRDAVTRETMATGVTDANGQFAIPELFEGYYEIEVTADKHITYRETSLVRAGVTNEVQAFLSRETVQYIWTVEPTEIEDRTRITIETVFETFVPIPVVTIEPNVIDLADITAEVTQIDMRISNHGLIAANDFKLGFSSHPDWQLEPLISEIGALPARSSLVIPLTIRRLKPAATQARVALTGPNGRPGLHGGGPCGIFGGGVWSLICGTKKSYSTLIQILNAGSGCGGGGGGTWGGNGSIGGPFVSVPIFPIKIDCNTNKPPCKALDLPEVNLSGLLKPIAKTFDGIANFYLEKNIWTRVLGLEVETEPEAKGKIGICCTNDVPVEEISATLSGKVKVKLGDAYKGKLNESVPDFQIANNIKGVLEFNGDYTFGVQAEPSIKISGSYKAGCGRKKPEVEVTVAGGIELQAGGFGKVKASFKALDLPVKLDAADVNLGVKGAIEFSYTYKTDEKPKFCYKSEGLYVQANAMLFGVSVDMFYPTNKYYLIQPMEICDPPAALLASLGIDQIVEEVQRQLAREVRAKQARVATHQPAEADEGGGVCAQVRLKLDQDLILTRNAFTATLELINNDPGLPLEDIAVQIGILNGSGRGAEDFFDIRTNQLSNITGVDGTGVLEPSSRGTASWLLVPTSDAAPEAPTNYQVGGILSYTQGGRRITVPFTPVPITVQPDPRLHVKYFHQRDVFSDDPFTPLIEPSVPYSLAVMIENSGKGTAKNVRITSAQPQIVENEKGLLIDFKIIGTEVAGQPATPSLTVDFGQINPGEITIGRWLLTSTLQGLFVDYKASIDHTAGPRDEKLSLIDDLSIHEMIHLVQAQGTLDDGKPDFLVNDVPDAEDTPETLYLSDGTTNRVNTVREASLNGQLSANNLSVQLSAAMPGDWAYLRASDPGLGQFRLLRVVRSDGKEISLGTNVWTTDRTFIGQGKKPRRENILHLLDYNSTGSYTLTYGPPIPIESEPPSSRVEALPADSFSIIPVSWSGADNPGGSGIAYYDIFVSVNDGPLTPWLQQSVINGAVYNGKLGNRYAFYSVATDNAGNREAAPAAPDAATKVSRENHAPTLALISDQITTESDILVVAPNASDPDGDRLTWSFVGPVPIGALIDPLNGVITWPTGEGLGPSTNRLTVQVLDNGLPRLGSTRTFSVIIKDNNAAPVFESISDRAIDEGRLLSVSSVVTDADLPRQNLNFRLAASGPPGTAIDANTGVFTWRPNETQGRTTNLITVIVSDDGTPSMSATQSFHVVVRDTRSDFTLRVGTTNVTAAASGSVPIILLSNTDLTNVTFQIEFPVQRLENLTLEPLIPQIGNAAVSPVANNRAAVQLTAAPGQILPSGKELARLHFTADTANNSAVVPLHVVNLEGTRSTGDVLVNATAQSGRVFLVGAEPVLDATIAADGSRQLVVYGPSSHSYEVQYRTNLSAQSPWTKFVVVTVAKDSAVIPAAPGQGQPAFYRVVEVLSGPPVLSLISSVDASRTIWLQGQPGKTYWIESRSNLANAAWVREGKITLIHSLQPVDGLIRPEGARFFRAVEE